MRPSVAASFPAFTRHFEGCVDHPYLDVEGYVTTGDGCIADPVSLAIAMPWQVGGVPCSASQIAADWAIVKGAPGDRTGAELDAWLHDHAASYYASLTPMRLTPAAVDELLLERLSAFEAILLGRFGDAWTSAPGNAQLATLSMCWADGAGGVVSGFPRFDAAFASHDWATCAEECHLEDSRNPGLVLRNAANKALFLAAAAGGDPDAIAWP